MSSAKAAIPATAGVSGGSNGRTGGDADSILRQVRDLMWRQVGIVRTRAGLKNAVSELQDLRRQLPDCSTRRGCETANVHLVAELIARSALARKESRGAHYRTDFPETDDKKFHRHSFVRGTEIRFE